MFEPLIGFILVIVPACVFISIIFFGKESTVRLLALACFMAFAGLMYIVSDSSNDLLGGRINALERKVLSLEYRNELKDQEVRRQIDEMMKR